MKKDKIAKALVLPVMAIVGLGAGFATMAGAQTTTATPSTTQVADSVDSDGTHDFSQGGHVGKNGVKEVLLTGTQAEQAKAAALVAVPGGTVERVETDSDGDAYEAHMTKSDGTHVTVKFDANFQVTGTEDGPSHR